MSEKYGITDAHYLCDSAIFNTETNEILKLYQICDLLNQQNQRIAELEEQLKNSEQVCLICHKDQEIQELKSKLEEDFTLGEFLKMKEQLKNAIVPKFKVGDKCWAIRNATNIYNEPKQVLIKEITITKNCIKYYAKNGCLTNRTNKTTMHIQSQLFATKEEAQAKLEELKGEKK